MEECIVIILPDKKGVLKIKESDMKNKEIEIWFNGRKLTMKITPKRNLVMN
jgi:hypothetical protein